MLQRFYPDEYMDSAYQIEFARLYQEGYRGVIFDIDNTLVPHGAPADEQAKALFSQLKELGYQCCLLSNNKEPRVKMFNDEVQVQYIFKAGKPKVSGYERADGDRQGQYPVRGGPDFYGCVWRQTGGPAYHPHTPHPSQRRDTDCLEAVFGEGGAVLLFPQTVMYDRILHKCTTLCYNKSIRSGSEL